MVAEEPGVVVKICGKCRTLKPLQDFWKDSTKIDGRRWSCIPCAKTNYHELAKRKGRVCPDCGTSVSPYRTYCRAHATKGERSSKWRGGRSYDGKGYVTLSGHQDHPNARQGGQIAEHILVMCEVIGRPLLGHETVHHKNGIKDDNRPENLELWSGSQPAGQRVCDKLAWALEIVRLYQGQEWL